MKMRLASVILAFCSGGVFALWAATVVLFMSAPICLQTTNVSIYDDPITHLRAIDVDSPPALIELNGCVLCEEVGALLAAVPSLRHLTIEHCIVSPGFWKALSASTTIERIRARWLDGMADQDAVWIAKLPSLHEFHIYRCDGVCNAFVDLLGDSKSLEELQIAQCNDVVLPELKVGPNVRRLSVRTADPA